MKATPIPDSVEVRPGGLQIASCRTDGTKITRFADVLDTQGRDKPGPWWHVETGRTTCGEKP